MKNSFISSFENNGRYNLKKIHVVVFIIVFILSLACCESLNRFFVISKASNFIRLNLFNKEKRDIEILFLGDSHFKLGIDSERFSPKTFDLSFGGASYIQSYYILKSYIRKLPSLKIVILPLDLNSFSSFRTDRIEVPIFWNKFIDYLELSDIKGPKILKNKFYITLLNKSQGRKFFVKNLRDFILQRSVWRRRLPTKIWHHRNASVNRYKTYRRVEFHLHNQDVFDPDLIIYFERILKLCKENNILIVTVQMPMSKDYIEYAARYINKDNITQKILKNPMYKNYIYRNFDYLEIYVDKDEFFMGNGDHLDVEGRKDFSNLFSQEITKIIKETAAK